MDAHVQMIVIILLGVPTILLAWLGVWFLRGALRKRRSRARKP